MRAAIYCRVSTDGQEDNASLPSQKRCRAHAGQLGANVSEAHVYREVHSGADLFGRPQLTRLREAMVGREFDVLIVHALDRLARDTDHQGYIFTEAKKAGVRIGSATEDLDNSFQGKLLRMVASVVAEAEREKIVERTTRGRIEKRKQGRVHWHGTLLYGYAYDGEKQRYVLDEFQAGIVRRIFREYIDGISTQQIANRLNAEGIPTATGRTWTRDRISDVVIHEEYATGVGYANRFYGRDYVKKHGLKFEAERPRGDWTEVRYPQIIDRETWDKAQARRASNKRFSVTNKAPDDYLLSGLMYCAECGKVFRVNTQVSSAGNRHRYYKCAGMERDPYTYKCRTPKALNATRIEPTVWEKFEAFMRDPGTVLDQYKRAMDVDTPGREELEKRLATAAGKLDELSGRRRRLIAAFSSGVIEQDDLDAQLKEMNQYVAHWTEERERLQAMLAQGSGEVAQLVGLFRAAEDFFQMTLGGWTIEQKREALRRFVSKVTLRGDGTFTLDLKHPSDEVKAEAREILSVARPYWDSPEARLVMDRTNDVCTTGATLEECASVLKRTGVERVVGLVFARA